MEPNIICSEDHRNTAVCVCFCHFPFPALCEGCLEKHSMDTDYLQHFHLPLSAGEVFKSEKEGEQVRQRIHKLHSAYTSLRTTEDDLLRFESDLDIARIEALRLFESEVNSLCTAAKHQLGQLRTALSAGLHLALREVSMHALEQWVPDATSLAALMWNYDGESCLKVFHGSAGIVSGKISEAFRVSMETSVPILAGFGHFGDAKPGVDALCNDLDGAKTQTERMQSEKVALIAEHQDVRMRIPDDSGEQVREFSEESDAGRNEYELQRKNSSASNKSSSQELERVHNLSSNSEQESRVLPQIASNFLTLYDLRTGQSTLSLLSTTFSTWTMYCFLDKESLLCVGGKNPFIGDSYVLRLKDGTVSEVGRMGTARMFCGIIKHESSVFVFGGSNSHRLKSCEKFAANHWSAIRDMQYARSSFCPCFFQGLVYLASCIDEIVEVVETFNVSSEEFKTRKRSVGCRQIYGKARAVITPLASKLSPRASPLHFSPETQSVSS